MNFTVLETELNSKLKSQHFMNGNNYTTYITIGNLRGGKIQDISGTKMGNVVTLYVQINGITSGGGDVEIFRFKDAYKGKYAPFIYGVHTAFISNHDNIVYIGQFSDGHFSMAIQGIGGINASKTAMVLFSITYLTKEW